ncbi:MAG TPA: alpha-galactosidase [Victivallales bacterium]|nr:alpha-galactosidase [Victivallales bacterium]
MVKIIKLNSKNITFILKSLDDNIPEIIYWGKKLDSDIDENNLIKSIDRPIPQAFLDDDIEISLLPEEGQGYFGAPGLSGHSQSKSWTTQFKTKNLDSWKSECAICCTDDIAKLKLDIAVELDYDTDVLQLKYTLTNTGNVTYELSSLKTTLPVPRSVNELMSFHGRWSHEFQTSRHEWIHGSYSRENRKGRTSSDNIPYLITGEKGFKETQGEVYGFHLGWSGNTEYSASILSDGRRVIQFSELLFPGEINLKPNMSYDTPVLYASYSSHGLNKLSNSFYNFLRKSNKFMPMVKKVRPVHFNTWEALYFDHNKKTLCELVEKAADLGIERFILDDGWFVDRNGERTGLGDWFVDKKKYPDGLKPLIDFVNKNNMEFGLWFEPEMINPNSNLYRKHPEWVLGVDGYNQKLGRYQYVLDLSNSDAYEYILDRLDSLLCEYNIKYIKWDMNRDLSQPGNGDDHPSVHNQVLNFYKLLKTLNSKHPDVEIESCSSGGSRVDFGVLRYTDRIWTSDCNDALERQNIQKGFSYFLPPELMGSHFGPSPAHTTLRRSSLQFRILTSLFGHLGFEQNVLTLSDDEFVQLKHYVKLYKNYRSLIHSGFSFRLDTCDPNLFVNGVISKDITKVLLAVNQLKMPEFMIPERIKIPYLNNNNKYRITVIDKPVETAFIMKKEPDWISKPIELTGELISEIGLQLPVMDPESIYLILLKMV